MLWCLGANLSIYSGRGGDRNPHPAGEHDRICQIQKASLGCCQLLLTIGSLFRDLIHKDRMGDILGIVRRHGFMNARGQDFLYIVAIVGTDLVNKLIK